jgi:hypothetical protein
MKCQHSNYKYYHLPHFIFNSHCLLNTDRKWKIPLGRPIYRWEDNIRIVLREIGWEGVNWMHLAQDRDQWWAFVNAVMNPQLIKDSAPWSKLDMKKMYEKKLNDQRASANCHVSRHTVKP